MAFQGRSNEEQMKMEEERLQKMFNKNVTVKEPTPQQKQEEEEAARQKEAQRIEKLNPEQQKKVLEAQKFLEKSTSPNTTTIGVPLSASTPEQPQPITEERVLCTFNLKANPTDGKKSVELDIKHSIQSVAISPIASVWDEEVSILVKGKDLKFECKHIERIEEETKVIKDTVRTIQGVVLPFELTLQNISLKPNATGLTVVISKPSF